MSRSAYAHTNRTIVVPTYDGRTLKHAQIRMQSASVRGGLSLTAPAFFRAIERIAASRDSCVPSADDPLVGSLVKMRSELEYYGINGYWRLRAWIDYHSDAALQARGLHGVEGRGGAWLVGEESAFRDLVRAYFDVVKRCEEDVKKARRRGVVMSARYALIGD